MTKERFERILIAYLYLYLLKGGESKMTTRMCHLCNTTYEDDPYLKEQPAHTPQHCLALLQYLYQETERKYRNAERQLERAKQEYHLRV